MAQRKKMTSQVERQIIEALINGHTISSACELLRISRMTEYRHRQQKKSYRERIDSALETRNELVEDALFNTALSGNVNAQRFFLINRGRPRWKSEFGAAVEEAEGVSVLTLSFAAKDDRNDSA